MKKAALLLVLTATLVSACSPKEQAQQHHQHQAPNGDIREQTASASVLPDFLKNKPEPIRVVYQAAGQATELLQWIPCFCGCGESAGHQSNLNCFIQKKNTDGSIVWDDHGTRCDVCLEIAVQSIRMKQDGKSDLEIRKFIDQTYKTGYAKPTPTPMPSA
ncbi:hypothetical protein PAESOLCIP111_04581 [Paenibacillus solanacearum]|uniref:Lipoprotein n=1 Tax=Paenibacillus solanacearum TaxID=2048548 RepID=A0A916K8E7_9BACL|nr:PCYCGC domain-containing protein [Paenibacillus solanacearum]CAG7643926.1 hypothetical protein PAESOLCIP111_04581 [Paenibacillus solanacearum]